MPGELRAQLIAATAGTTWTWRDYAMAAAYGSAVRWQ